MAYNNYFPATYQPNYFGQPNQYAYHQMQQQGMVSPQQVQQQQTPPMQNGFVLIPSEQDARSYPVAPGNSITFKNENAPYCYVKTMGFNQLDKPLFEKYRLVKEEDQVEAEEQAKPEEKSDVMKKENYATKDDLNEIWKEMYALKKKIKEQSDKKSEKIRPIVTEEEDDE